MNRQGVKAVNAGAGIRPASGLQALANVPSKGYFNNAGIGAPAYSNAGSPPRNK